MVIKKTLFARASDNAYEFSKIIATSIRDNEANQRVQRKLSKNAYEIAKIISHRN